MLCPANRQRHRHRCPETSVGRSGTALRSPTNRCPRTRHHCCPAAAPAPAAAPKAEGVVASTCRLRLCSTWTISQINLLITIDSAHVAIRIQSIRPSDANVNVDFNVDCTRSHGPQSAWVIWHFYGILVRLHKLFCCSDHTLPYPCSVPGWI